MWSIIWPVLERVFASMSQPVSACTYELVPIRSVQIIDETMRKCNVAYVLDCNEIGLQMAEKRCRLRRGFGKSGCSDLYECSKDGNDANDTMGECVLALQ